ncbi:hypothetical protein Rxycam_03138 [Rubrobacter xylanophilus DSM 9941]|uniref:helix-turn-helix domain-containing protein n=1 Tax=Rubrobacter xylanophilus TaxID=49319 RepID=UPI00398B623B|nr:hypothetical protein Rxycam_03138 [Rubrobacter xylanophilus DSM 9941]
MGFVFDTRPADSPFVEMIWRARSDEAGTFTSVAASNWELVFTACGGGTRVVTRGPETRASEAEYPAGAEFLGITFRLGTFMPHLPLSDLLDRRDAVLPAASGGSFWLHGSVWELPSYENADVFVGRLVRRGTVVRDPVVEAALRGRPPQVSVRSLQYRFLRATGLTRKLIQQIERARSAVSMLERGAAIPDVVFELGYFDQAHLTNSLRRFVGETPARIARRHTAG